VKDYKLFVEATKRDWPDSQIVTGEHPAANVSWDDAAAFCKWLTDKERNAGQIGGDQSYRLPSDEEWSAAVGLPGESGSTPAARDMKAKGVYPWGTKWPPPKGAGNYSPSQDVDNYDLRSPVGSFEANQYGISDLGGNVWEWCQDWYDAEKKYRVLRGGSWLSFDSLPLLSSYRHQNVPESRVDGNGFRCVLASALMEPIRTATDTAGQLPPKLQSLLSRSQRLSGLEVNTSATPPFLVGDFDGDGKSDYAVQLKRTGGTAEEIAILLGAGKVLLISDEQSIGHNYPGGEWGVLPKNTAVHSVPELNKGLPAPKLTGDAIELTRPESSQAVLYWSAGRPRLYWTAD
jgi:hypothetical protein